VTCPTPIACWSAWIFALRLSENFESRVDLRAPQQQK
jgi:hypothetical protein